MAFTTEYRCTDCDQLVGTNIRDHDCPDDPMKDPVKIAAAEEWEREFERNNAAWEAFQDTLDSELVAIPSVKQYPEEIAFEGRCVVIDTGDNFWGEDECGNFVSDVLDRPTWGDMLIQFDKAINTTQDFHHSFMEGVGEVDEVPEWVDVDDDVTVLKFHTGS